MEISQRYNSVPAKDNCALFAPTPLYFWARAIRWRHLNFSLADPCCHGNEFRDKIDYNSAPVKYNCALFAPTPPPYTQLIGYIAWQWDRYLVLQNVFLVFSELWTMFDVSPFATVV